LDNHILIHVAIQVSRWGVFGNWQCLWNYHEKIYISNEWWFLECKVILWRLLECKKVEQGAFEMDLALMIDGRCLMYALDLRKIQKTFLKLFMMCKVVVVCCHVSPLQKAQVSIMMWFRWSIPICGYVNRHRCRFLNNCLWSEILFLWQTYFISLTTQKLSCWIEYNGNLLPIQML